MPLDTGHEMYVKLNRFACYTFHTGFPETTNATENNKRHWNQEAVTGSKYLARNKLSGICLIHGQLFPDKYLLPVPACWFITPSVVVSHVLGQLVSFQRMDGWMTCDFTSFSTVFQSYQDDGRMIMKRCVQWSSVYIWEDFASSGDGTWSARSVGQHLTHWATGAPPLSGEEKVTINSLGTNSVL